MASISRSQAADELGISVNSTAEEIREAYLRLAKKWHPDKNGHNIEEATEKFKIINSAYVKLTTQEDESPIDSHYDFEREEGVWLWKMEDIMAFFVDIQNNFYGKHDYRRTTYSRSYGARNVNGAWYDRQAKMKAERELGRQRLEKRERELERQRSEKRERELERQRSEKRASEQAQQAAAAAEAERRKMVQEAEQQAKEEARLKHEAEEAEKRRKAAEKRRQRDLQVLGAAGIGREDDAMAADLEVIASSDNNLVKSSATETTCELSTGEVAEENSRTQKEKKGKLREKQIKEKMQQTEKGVAGQQHAFVAAKPEDSSSSSNPFAALEPRDMPASSSNQRRTPRVGRAKAASASTAQERSGSPSSCSGQTGSGHVPQLPSDDTGAMKNSTLPGQHKGQQKVVGDVLARKIQEEAGTGDTTQEHGRSKDGTQHADGNTAGAAIPSLAHPTVVPAQEHGLAATVVEESPVLITRADTQPEETKIEWKIEMERWDASRRLDEQRAKQVQEARLKKEEEKRKEKERRQRAEQILLEKQAGGPKKGKAKKTVAVDVDVLRNRKQSEPAAMQKQAKPKVPGLEDEIWDLPQIDKWAKEDSLAWQQLLQERRAMEQMMSPFPPPMSHRREANRSQPQAEFHNPLVQSSLGSGPSPKWPAQANFGGKPYIGGKPGGLDKNGAPESQSESSEAPPVAEGRGSEGIEGRGSAQVNHPLQHCRPQEGRPSSPVGVGEGHNQLMSAHQEVKAVGWTRAEDLEKELVFGKIAQVCQEDLSEAKATNGAGGSPSSPLDIPSAPQSPDAPKTLQEALLSVLHPRMTEPVGMSCESRKTPASHNVYNPLQRSSKQEYARTQGSRALPTPYRPQGVPPLSSTHSPTQPTAIDAQRLVPFPNSSIFFPAPVNAAELPAMSTDPSSPHSGSNGIGLSADMVYPESNSMDVDALTGLLTHGPSNTTLNSPAKKANLVYVGQPPSLGHFQRSPLQPELTNAGAPLDISSVLLPGAVRLAGGSVVTSATGPVVQPPTSPASEQQHSIGGGVQIGLPVMGFPTAVQLGVPVGGYQLPMNGIMFGGASPAMPMQNVGMAVGSWQASPAMRGYFHNGQWPPSGAAEMQQWTPGCQMSESDALWSPENTFSGFQPSIGVVRDGLAEDDNLGTGSPVRELLDCGEKSAGFLQNWHDGSGNSQHREVGGVKTEDGLVQVESEEEAKVAEDLRNVEGKLDGRGDKRHGSCSSSMSVTGALSERHGRDAGKLLQGTQTLSEDLESRPQASDSGLLDGSTNGWGTTDKLLTVCNEESLSRWGVTPHEQVLHGKHRAPSPSATGSTADRQEGSLERHAVPIHQEGSLERHAVPIRHDGVVHEGPERSGWTKPGGQPSQDRGCHDQAVSSAWGEWKNDVLWEEAWDEARDNADGREWLPEAGNNNTASDLESSQGQLAMGGAQSAQSHDGGDGQSQDPCWEGWNSVSGSLGDDKVDVEGLPDSPREPEGKGWTAEGGRWSEESVENAGWHPGKQGGNEMGSAHSAGSAPESIRGKPVRSPGQKICRHFQRGRCQFGDRCRYSHAPPPVQQQSSHDQRVFHSPPDHPPPRQNHRLPQPAAQQNRAAAHHSAPRNQTSQALTSSPSSHHTTQGRPSGVRRDWMPRQMNDAEGPVASPPPLSGWAPGSTGYGGHRGVNNGAHSYNRPRRSSRGRGHGPSQSQL